MEYGTGALCASLAGHDKGEVFVIIEEDGEYVCLVNGASRPLQSPRERRRSIYRLFMMKRNGNAEN